MSSSNHVEQEIHLESMKAVCMATGEPSSSLLNIIDLERYSSLNKLLAVTSCVIRFLTNCKSGEKDRKFGPLTTQELSIAMTLWIKAVQGQIFSREIQQLSRKDTKLSLPLIRQLRLYLDDIAVLRCRGRLESTPLMISQFPVLLPKNEHSQVWLLWLHMYKYFTVGSGKHLRNSGRSTGYLVDVSSLEASYANV